MTDDSADPQELASQERSDTAHRWWPLAKWTMFALMLYFVGQRAVALWQSSPAIELHVDLRWLIPSAVLYLVGWLPSVWFWRALLNRMDQHPDWYATVRAYFVGHIGKYVPGKALVLVIRGALLKDAGAKPMLAALTAVYETLVFMAAGAAIAVALAPTVIPESLWIRLPTACQFVRQQPLLVPLVVAIATIASTPFSAWLFTRIGRKALPRTGDVPSTARISARLVILGVFVTSLGWMLNALSLGCTLQAVSDDPVDIGQFPVWLASITASTFLGFVVLIAPGGLGVREWLLIEMLKDQPAIGSERAIVVAALLRMVWFVTELIAATIFFVIRPRRLQNATDFVQPSSSLLPSSEAAQPQ